MFRLRETPKNASPEVSGGQNLLFDYPARVSNKSVMYERPTGVPSQSILQKCEIRVFCKSVKSVMYERPTRVSNKSVP